MARSASLQTYIVFSQPQANLIRQTADKAHIQLEDGPVQLGRGCILVAEADLARLADFDDSLISRLRARVPMA